LKDSPHASERNLEYRKAKNEGKWAIDLDESWVKEEGVYNKELYNAMNERNLTAAFTDSKHVFHPRAFHTSKNIYEKKWEPVKEDVLNRLKNLPLSQKEIDTLRNRFNLLALTM
jgi:hypothetical protein